MSELKPCPFCGESDTEVMHIHHKTDEEDYWYYFAGCRYCWIGFEDIDRAYVVTKWNTRAGLEVLGGETDHGAMRAPSGPHEALRGLDPLDTYTKDTQAATDSFTPPPGVSVSEHCRRTHQQACGHCDDLTCGDNTSEVIGGSLAHGGREAMIPEQRVAYVAAQTAAALIEMEAMKAANKERETHGYALAWDEGAFLSLITKYGLGENTIIKLFQD